MAFAAGMKQIVKLSASGVSEDTPFGLAPRR
jgi:hypothetical protein